MGGVEHHVGGVAKGPHPLALGQSGLLQAHVGAFQGMGPAGSGVAADDLAVVGLEKDNLGEILFAPHLGQGRAPVGVEIGLAHVHAQGQTLVALAALVVEKAHELGHEADRQPVHAKKTQVLEDAQGCGFSGPGQAGQDDDGEFPGRVFHGVHLPAQGLNKFPARLCDDKRAGMFFREP